MFKKISLIICLAGIILLVGCTQVSDVIDEEGKKMGEVKTTVDEEGTETTIHIETVEKGVKGKPCKWVGQCDSLGTMLGCIHGTCQPVECKAARDCEPADDICFQHSCFTEEELLNRFDTWTPSQPCKGVCDNCASGKFESTWLTIMVQEHSQEYRICTDCSDDDECKEGFWCEVGKCVAAGAAAQAEAVEEPAVPTTEGLCNDGIDNDEDGCADDVDSDCGGKETRCDDNIDNDCDGLVDCADLDGCDPGNCGYGCACERGKKIEQHCTGDYDNDGDGLTDCDDPDCQFGNPNKWDGADACWEDTCNDGLDNDADGLTDCDDSDCADNPAC